MLGFILGVISCLLALLFFVLIMFAAFGSAASAFED